MVSRRRIEGTPRSPLRRRTPLRGRSESYMDTSTAAAPSLLRILRRGCRRTRFAARAQRSPTGTRERRGTRKKDCRPIVLRLWQTKRITSLIITSQTLSSHMVPLAFQEVGVTRNLASIGCNLVGCEGRRSKQLYWNWYNSFSCALILTYNFFFLN